MTPPVASPPAPPVEAPPTAVAPSPPPAPPTAARVRRPRRWPALAVLGITTVVAYGPALGGLARWGTPGTIAGQGALAIALVVVGIIAGAADRRPHRTNIHDTEVDAFVGATLLAAAVLATWLLPRQMGDLAPVWRPDLVGLGLFLAGGLCLSLGVRNACRCWPALLGLALVHPVIVQLVLVPLDHVVLRGTRALAGAMAGTPVVSTADGLSITFAHDGAYHAVDLTAALSAYALVPLTGMALVAVAAVLKGPVVARLALVPVGTALVAATLTARVAVGVLVATGVSPGAAQPVLGAAGTVAALGLGVALAGVAAARLGLSWRAPATEAPAQAAPRRLPVLVVALALALGALAVANVGLGRQVVEPSTFGSMASIIPANGEPRLDGFTATSASQGPSPYVEAPVDGAWRRIHYTARGAGTVTAGQPSQVVLDVVDAADPSAMQLYPTRLLYDGFDQSVNHRVALAPGLEGRATTYLGNDGRPALTTVTWLWEVPTGRFEQVTLVHSLRPPGYGLPEPGVDLGRGLALSLGSMLRGDADGSPVPDDADVAAVESGLLDQARSLIAAVQAEGLA